jgi:hypothetical protein
MTSATTDVSYRQNISICRGDTVCSKRGTGIEPKLLWLLTNKLETVWPTLPTHRVRYIANITDHDDVGVVCWDQNTFTPRKDVSCQNNKKKITTPPK